MSTAVDPTAPGAARAVPDGYVLHSESSTSILFALPTSTPSARKNESKGAETRAPVFLNPVQQFNRDISIVAIRAWSEIRQDEKRAQWTQGITKKLDKAKGMQATRAVEAVEAVEQQGASKRRKVDAEIESGGEALPTASADEVTATGAKVAAVETVEVDSVPNGLVQQLTKTLETPPTYTFTILEALSASGLRAIRYAKEIPLLRYVIANDLEPSAVESIRKNVEWNGLGPTASAPAPVEASTSDAIIENEPAAKGSLQTTLAREGALLGKVRPNEGDACGVMYSHRTPEKRFDCIDLDPYGSAVPFLDAAIGAVTDGGLLCITCTDLAVLAGHNYPEKCFSHYGGTSVNAEYSHEVALRLVLSTIAASAARYGRYIVPHLSLSIDFYVRVFVRVYTSPKEVKQLASNTALLFYCHDCQASYLQPFGRMSEKISKSGQTNVGYHVASGPPPEVGERCGECGGKFHVGGPLWAGPLHKKDFVAKMLQHVQSSREAYGTSTRIEGMLSVAHSEIAAPFYFTPGRLSGLFHCISPPIVTYASALLNAGYEVSRSHASAGSLKTNASRSVVHDVMRAWIVENPVSMKNIKEGTPTARLLAKERTVTIDLSRNAGVETAIMSNIKVVRYQMNPTANWGPLKAAVQGGK